jgi:phosphoenolpyruvate---glycerone phosphotransferase subunit DhaL
MHDEVIAWLRAVAPRIHEQAPALTALDQAIGDGDHGINMKRGFEAVKADAEGMAAGDLPAALHKLGMTLVMKVGGASGPLYGTLFMALGKAMPPDPDRAQATSALASAIAAVKARGKSEVGQKTLLDVLDPVHRALAEGADAAGLRSAAREAAKATIPLKATRGRASFLGERSIGHMDPGARSSEIMVDAVLDALEQRS